MLNLLVIARLHNGDNLSRVIVVELGSGTHRGADTTIHASLESLLKADILGKHIIIFTHKHNNFDRAKVEILAPRNVSINT